MKSDKRLGRNFLVHKKKLTSTTAQVGNKKWKRNGVKISGNWTLILRGFWSGPPSPAAAINNKFKEYYRYITGSWKAENSQPDTHRSRFQKTTRQIKNISSNPSEEEEERDAVAGLGSKVGYDLRDFRNSPTDETGETESKWKFILDVAKAIFEIPFNPAHTPFPLLHTIIYTRHPLPSPLPPTPLIVLTLSLSLSKSGGWN